LTTVTLLATSEYVIPNKQFSQRVRNSLLRY